jgi:hypothetical protein
MLTFFVGLARRLGGEPLWRRRLRHERDTPLRALAGLLGADLPLERQARLIIERARRYRPRDGDAAAVVLRWEFLPSMRAREGASDAAVLLGFRGSAGRAQGARQGHFCDFCH